MGSIPVLSDGGTQSGGICSNKEEFNNVHELITKTSKRYGDKRAIICGGDSLTYAKLEEYSNNFAGALVQRDVGHGSLIAVCLDRSVDMVVAILGVWKAGAAYVPIEPSLPSDRVYQMLADSNPQFIITGHGEPLDMHLDTAADYLSIQLAHQPHSVQYRLYRKLKKKNDLAYVMYTSGSTGRPKGVEVTQGSIINLLHGMQRQPGCTEEDSLLAITTISFDMAIPELFLPLVCGATTVIARRREIQDMPLLIELLERHNITIIQGTPAIYRMLLDSGWHARPRLQQIWCGGEALPKALASRLLDLCDTMWNLYGPTEATVYSSMWRVQNGEEVIIGSPILNGHLYVLDEYLNLVPFGEVGELYIGGVGVAKGYRNNEELTRTRFFPNPFHGGTMYKTGDAARCVGPIQVSVLGRLDGQIKIRGHRIEPGDIEAAMTAIESISAAVVICRDERLIGYYVRRDENQSQRSPAKDDSFDRALRSSLARHLPAYMVPAFFVGMQTFPITPNGKIDRKALPDAVETSDNGRDVFHPSDLEARLLRIWADVLGHRSFGVKDNFFEVGGDSLRLVRLQKQLQASTGLSVPAHVLFEKYTIKTLAQHLHVPLGASDMQMPTAEPGAQSGLQESIAIVSTSCRLPGGIESPEDFWHLLNTGGDATATLPKGRWNTDDIHLDGHLQCQKGGFITSVNDFDLSFFGISPREGQRLDPAQYMMLETSWEAFERAGYTMNQLRDSQTGVFIGTSNILSHQSLNEAAVRDLESLDGYTVTGSAAATMSGRISYLLGLQGPAMTVDTACSSSLVATHLACNSLRSQECDLALVGGVSLMLNPGLHVEFERLRGMSPDGRCRSFSDDSQGTGWSEGSVSILLKRLSDARRDGDSIHGVIRGSAVNHDGRSASLTTPSGRAQQNLINKALSAAQVHPNDIDYIEAHGTATKLGDPIEANAIADVFSRDRRGRGPLLIGSAKSNLGHTQAAAGLVGMLKVILSMKHAILPESIHITTPTSAVDWRASNMAPVQKRQLWNASGTAPRRAGVSAFGIGGTNAHVVVEENVLSQREPRDEEALTHLLPFLLSGDTDAAIRAQARKLHDHLSNETQPSTLQDIAYSLATSRTHFRKRSALWALDRQELFQNLQALYQDFGISKVLGDSCSATGSPSRLTMLFTGQGSQWIGMGRDLYDRFPVFRASLDEIAALFNTTCGVPLLDVIWAKAGSPNATLLSTTEYGQPAIFAVEASLWRLWQDWGVTPDFVLGHSLGELTAAYAAGVVELADACRLVATRGRLMQAQSGDYLMVAIEANAEEVGAAITQFAVGEMVEVALYNTPGQVVLSGRACSVNAITNHFKSQRRKTSVVVEGHAFHSRYMDGMLSTYAEVVESVRFHPTSKIHVVSSVNARLAQAQELSDPRYWIRQAREPVRFCESVQALADQGANAFLELGPDQVLCGLAAASLGERDELGDFIWLSSMKRGDGKDSVARLLQSASFLHLRNSTIDWNAVLGPWGGKPVCLPTYAFQRNYKPPSPATKFHGPILQSDPVRSVNAVVENTHDGFSFQVSWVPAKSHARQPAAVTWGLMDFSSNSEWSESVTAAFVQAGVQLLRVEDFELAQDYPGVVCMWDSSPEGKLRSRELMSNALSQLQTAANMQSRSSLVWITRQAVGTGSKTDDRGTVLGAGPLLWGLMRTARSEQPHLDLRLIDVGDNASGNAITSAVMIRDEPESAVRRDLVLIPRLERVKPDRCSLGTTKLVRADGAVLITGGLGHLGLCIAEWLISQHGIRNIVLASRRGLDTEGATQAMKKLTALGAKVTVVACDVTSSADVNKVIETFRPQRPLRGVIHAAGLVDSGVLTSLTPERCERVLAPKAHGAWLLHNATTHLDLDIFVLYSSISGTLGMPGLANYAAANTYLDALAHLRRAQGLPATSVAYGTLGNRGGMASRLPRNTRLHLSQFGLETLSEEQGLDLMASAIRSRRALTVAAALKLSQLQHYLDERNDPVPPFLTSLLSPTTESKASTDGSAESLRDKVADAEIGQRPEIVFGAVQKIVASTLGFKSVSEVDMDRSLKGIGIDSLTAIQLRNRLASATGLPLPVNLAFSHPSLRSLSRALYDGLLEGEQHDQSPKPWTEPTVNLNIPAIRAGCLDETFTFQSDACVERPRSVFLTGATGFVGAFILNELVNHRIATHCLVRASSPNEAAQRLFNALHHYGFGNSADEAMIRPLVGDMSQPLLGLSSQQFDDLANQVDAICHSGGLVDWARPFDEYVGPNIVSTHEILRLASKGRPKTVHLVSTISTLPKYMGLEFTEQELEYGYGTSKFLAERMMAAARWRGAQATIYRLPYVTASSTTGHFRQDQGDFLHNFIVGCRQLGSFPSINADLRSVLPVDYVAKTIVSVISKDRDKQGQDYDFVNASAPSCKEFFASIIAIDGHSAAVLPFHEWKKKALAAAEDSPGGHLSKISIVLDSYTSDTATTMFKGQRLGRNVLGRSEYPTPLMNEQFVARYMSQIESS